MGKVISFLKSILSDIENAIYDLALLLSKGFFFYFYLIAFLLYKILPLSFFEKLKVFFKKRQEDALSFLIVVVIFLLGVNIYVRFYSSNKLINIDGKSLDNNLIQSEVNKLDSTELNLYRKYAKLSINAVSLDELKKTNDDVVSWLMVDHTNINYPIVQADDNNYYLNHDIDKKIKSSGWTFMDYRNNSDLSDDNTIFYGHNLANKTAFGSLSNLFTDEWYNNSNHLIVVLNDDHKYVYEIFSVYEIKSELYYLQNNFFNKESALTFYNTLKDRSIYNFKVDFEKNDKIITLSTCSDDNKARRVVHAKLINK